MSPAGSHKPNTAVAQAYYNKQAGIKRLTTETGAGQWGSRWRFASQMFGLEVRVFMVKVSYHQKPYRRSMMQTWGANVFASRPTLPIREGRFLSGTRIPGLAGNCHLRSGGGGSEQRRHQLRPGSVLNHVLLHQTVIGEEAKTAGDGWRLP